MKTVRTRFAPSPTGFLHIGGVRTALFNYLYAKKHSGEFVLRLEDTDRERFIAEGIEQIYESLKWLGLVPDKGFWIHEDKHSNLDFVQSERQKTGLYQKFADQLIGKGFAYYSYATPDEYQAYKKDTNDSPFAFKKYMEGKYYDGLKSTPKGSYPIRLDTQAIIDGLVESGQDPAVVWHDEIRGEFMDDLRLLEDFIIIKSDGFPTYNFANVIDDHAMEISHAIRGDEFIASSGKHALLYDLFGWERPVFVHLPVINGTDGKKLSKRTGDTNTLEYRDKGYLPEALLNFLALLGWNDGTEQEIFTQEELIKKFSLERVNTSPAIFDSKRLDWVNGTYIRQLPLDELYERVKDFWPQEADKYDAAYKKQVLGLIQERLKYFAELPELTLFFFKDLPIDHALISSHKQLKKLSKDELKALLQTSRKAIASSDFTTDNLTKKLNNLLESTGQKPAVVFSLIRIATTQAPASPGLAETLAVFGKEKTLQRIEQQLQSL
jgi:glutamyl-tRNA synthetase